MMESSLNLLLFLEPKRDAYGFAVRSQHIQAYKQYVNIYKEEEEERSGKWRIFLEQFAKPTEPCFSEEGHSQPPAEGTKLKEKALPGEENKERLPVEATGLNEEVVTEAKEETASEKEHKVTLQTEGIQFNEKAKPEEEGKQTFPAEDANLKENVASPDEGKETPKTEATELKEEVSPEEREEGDAPSTKLDSDGSNKKPHSAGLPRSLTKKTRFALPKESEREKEVQLAEETKKRGVERWAKTRPALCALENMMISRVKNVKNMKNMNINESGTYLPSIKESRSPEGESEDECEEKVCVNEMSAREESDAGNRASKESFFPWKEELESLVHGGVPKDLRGEVWQAFVGVKARRVESYYEDLLAQETFDDDNQHSNSSGVVSKWRKQIEKDLPRTFPGHPAMNDNGRDSLRRVLLAYARHNPSVGYCQAMNFFAGLLLLLMSEENAFWTLVGIIDDYFDGYFTEEMIESQVDQLVFEELMRERFPKLVNHLDYLGVQVAWISGSWFLSIFINVLPWESVLRIWDVLLFEGNRVMLFRTALALMELYGPALVTTNEAGDAIILLQSLVGSTFDSSQLVLTACMGFLGVTDARLWELRDKHRPSVLEIVEERTRGQVSKDSKGIANKLYSFKHDRGSLMEERKPAEDVTDEDASKLKPCPSNLDELLCSLNIDSELDALPDPQDQVDWMKVELCRLLEEKRAAVLRAEELETALVEMVKDDNRRQLSAKIEELELKVADLHQALDDKNEQEAALVKVLMRLDQEQRILEDNRRNAEQEAAAHRNKVTMLQEKYEKAMASIAQMEKRVVMAESMLEATLQYESGQAKAQSSLGPQLVSKDSAVRKVGAGLLSLSIGWRNKMKGKLNAEESTDSKTSPTTPTQEETNSQDDQQKN